MVTCLTGTPAFEVSMPLMFYNSPGSKVRRGCILYAGPIGTRDF